MQYRIYHRDKLAFPFGDKNPAENFPEGYTKVATVECSLDDVFRVTNHIEHNWQENPEVVEIDKRQARSTSVGDVVIDSAGDKFVCANFGWNMF